MRSIDLRGRDLAALDLAAVVPRAPVDVTAATAAVAPVLQDVAQRGEAALKEYSERFDGVVAPSLRVPAERIAAAVDTLDPELRAALQTTIDRRRAVAQAEAGPRQTVVDLAPGAQVRQRLIPVRRVGLYVPGGLAPLCSSVMMSVVPAQVAGVESIAVACPPQRDYQGWPHPAVLATCGLLGVTEVYAVGGAQAIAMFGHGVADLCPPVDMITGPGNVYVVAAKRLLQGTVGIDTEAGPTEIAVIGDAGANPVYIAADLISQAEHDPLAGAVLITQTPALAAAVSAELETQVAATKHAERVRAALGGQQSAIVLVDDQAAAVAVADAYGAEHLEIHTENAAALADQVRNAGAIFIGSYAPVALGDYAAGSTHVLPTAGCARYSAGLTVGSFLKPVHVINYDQAALRTVAGAVAAISAAEDLPAHGAAVAVRFADDDQPPASGQAR